MLARCEFCGKAHGNVSYDFDLCLARCRSCGHVWITHWSWLMHDALTLEIHRVDKALTILRGGSF